jgi:hypothetical protein
MIYLVNFVEELDSQGRAPPLDGSARLDHCAAMNGHFLIVGICRGIIR